MINQICYMLLHNKNANYKKSIQKATKSLYLGLPIQRLLIINQSRPFYQLDPTWVQKVKWCIEGIGDAVKNLKCADSASKWIDYSSFYLIAYYWSFHVKWWAHTLAYFRPTVHLDWHLQSHEHSRYQNILPLHQTMVHPFSSPCFAHVAQSNE